MRSRERFWLFNGFSFGQVHGHVSPPHPRAPPIRIAPNAQGLHGLAARGTRIPSQKNEIKGHLWPVPALPAGTSLNAVYFGRGERKKERARGRSRRAAGALRRPVPGGVFGVGPAGARRCRCPVPWGGGSGSRRGGGRSLTCAASSFVSCSGLGRIWTFCGRWRRHPRNLRRDGQRP